MASGRHAALDFSDELDDARLLLGGIEPGDPHDPDEPFKPLEEQKALGCGSLPGKPQQRRRHQRCGAIQFRRSQ